MITRPPISTLFLFNDTATTEIYTLSLHDALPISRIYKDGGDPAGNALGDAHVRRVNPLRCKVFNRGRAKQIAPYFCHHAYVRSAETRGNRLVGAFSAEAKIELLAEDRFPWTWEHGIERGKVHIGAAHDRNKGWLGHHFSSGDSARGLYKNPAREPHKLSIARRNVSPLPYDLDRFPSVRTSSDSHSMRKQHYAPRF